MYTAKRLTLKSVTWQVSGLIVMSLISFMFTGSLETGSKIAITSAIIGFMTYFLHELLWSRIKWGTSQS